MEITLNIIFWTIIIIAAAIFIVICLIVRKQRKRHEEIIREEKRETVSSMLYLLRIQTCPYLKKLLKEMNDDDEVLVFRNKIFNKFVVTKKGDLLTVGVNAVRYFSYNIEHGIMWEVDPHLDIERAQIYGEFINAVC